MGVSTASDLSDILNGMSENAPNLAKQSLAMTGRKKKTSEGTVFGHKTSECPRLISGFDARFVSERPPSSARPRQV